MTEKDLEEAVSDTMVELISLGYDVYVSKNILKLIQTPETCVKYDGLFQVIVGNKEPVAICTAKEVKNCPYLSDVGITKYVNNRPITMRVCNYQTKK